MRCIVTERFFRRLGGWLGLFGLGGLGLGGLGLCGLGLCGGRGLGLGWTNSRTSRLVLSDKICCFGFCCGTTIPAVQVTHDVQIFFFKNNAGCE